MKQTISNMLDKVLFEIRWFFKINWPMLLFVAVLIGFGFGLYSCMKNYEPPREQIKMEARGTIVDIRSTGAFNIYDTEIKFKDGSIILLTYSMVRRYNLKIGQNIRIVRSSRSGRRIEFEALGP